MPASATPTGQPETPAEYRALADGIDRDLSEARQLLIEQHNEMALLRAVASFEWFMKRAYLEPYIRMAVPGFDGEIANLIIDALRRPNGWRNEVPRLLRTFWSINVRDLPAWTAFLRVWDLRNSIAHDGGRCDRAQAEDAINTCQVVIRTLLVNRIDATSRAKSK